MIPTQLRTLVTIVVPADKVRVMGEALVCEPLRPVVSTFHGNETPDIARSAAAHRALPRS